MECLTDVDSTCRLCVGKEKTELTSIQPYIVILCKLGEFSMDPRLPQKVCGKCLALVEIAETLRQSIDDVEPFWSQCLTMKKEVVLSPEPEQELQISDVCGGVEDSRNDSGTIDGLHAALQEGSFKVELQTTDYGDLDHMTPLELFDGEDGLKMDGQYDDDEDSEDMDYVPSPEDVGKQENHKENAEKINPKERPTFPCPLCTSVFSWRESMQKHLRKEHPGQSACMKCSLTFSTSSGLTTHKIFCSKSVKCFICKAECENGEEYENHLRTFHKKKTFVCDYEGCGHASLHNSHMHRHKRTHSTVKKFKCSYKGCDANFHRKDDLNRHVRHKHTGEQPFECRHCKKMFCQSGHRNRHQMICKNNK